MSKAIIWSQDGCQWCDTAVALLKARGCEVEERKIGGGTWTKKDLIQAVPDARSVPQIFIDDIYVGGYSHLVDEIR